MVSRQVTIIVIGTRHDNQRYEPDNDPAMDRVRRDFEAMLLAIIASRHVELVAEEGNNESQEPMGLQVCRKYQLCRHIDIRPPRGEHMNPQQYEEEMFRRTAEALGDATVVVVICGGDHVGRLSNRFSDAGLQVESRSFQRRRR
jgi:hypothetical protein